MKSWIPATVIVLTAVAGIVCMALKLTGAFAWPWWLVLLPFTPLGLFLVVMFLGALLLAVLTAQDFTDRI
jgi:hypothetical protein